MFPRWTWAKTASRGVANSTTTTEHIQFNYFYSCSLRARRAVFKVLGPVTPSFEVTEGVGGGGALSIPIKKNRGHRSRFMAKRQHKWQFWLQMIIYEKGPGRFSRSARSQPRGVIVIIAINQLEYKKDLCCLSLGDWTKLPPHFMCQCYEQQVMRSAVLTSY